MPAIRVMLFIENEKEVKILDIAFRQQGINVKTGKCDRSGFMQLLQIAPDIIIVEVPKQY